MELIFDRTQADINNDTDKAYISYADLNRIEEACEELAELLGVSVQTKVWKMEDFRTEQDMSRIRKNIYNLQQSTYVSPDGPRLPNKITFASFQEANAIEECLYRIWDICNTTKNGSVHLAFTCGRKAIGNKGGA